MSFLSFLASVERERDGSRDGTGDGNGTREVWCERGLMWAPVFEGEAHPYKVNLVKFDGRTRKVRPEVNTEVLEQNSI